MPVLIALALGLAPLVWAAGCTNADRGEQTPAGNGAADEDDGTDDGDDGDDGDGQAFDVGEGGAGDGAGEQSCEVEDDLDGVGECDEVAPPDSFEPDLQWAFTPENGEIMSVVTPLVANLTDDNDDGVVDLCDVPDVVLVSSAKLVQPPEPGRVYVLDGLTGTVHTRFEIGVKQNATPAIADIDNDGVPEIVTQLFEEGRMAAFSPDGTLEWSGTETFPDKAHGSAVAIADVDNDGDPEIVYDDMLFDHEGRMLWDAGVQQIVADVTAIADLDGDSDMEIVFGHAAVHHDGSVYYTTTLTPGFAAIADLDDDPEPEVLLTNEQGINLLEHDGTIKYSEMRPTGVEANGLNWARPATVHNFDGDPEAEFAMSSNAYYSVYERDATIVWSAEVLDESGFAAGTAFDFLGDGEAEAMYADESTLFIFDGQGSVLLSQRRLSHTLHEYPVVADIDNDGSAEIVVVSEERAAAGPNGNPTIPTIQAIRDVEDRWIQARRIWNQHTYHVTNVREDATIPQFEVPHWRELNTFRTNAQLDSSGEVCEPDPEG